MFARPRLSQVPLALLVAGAALWGFTHNSVAHAAPLLAPAAPLGGTSYCTAGTTTNGCNATMVCVGVPSLTGGGFQLAASSVPGQRLGAIRYAMAPKTVPMPWGMGSTSYICIQAPFQSTGIMNSGGTNSSCDGVLLVDLFAWFAAHPVALGQPIAPGTTIYAQAIFKDPGAPKNTNLSDALSVTLLP